MLCHVYFTTLETFLKVFSRIVIDLLVKDKDTKELHVGTKQ